MSSQTSYLILSRSLFKDRKSQDEMKIELILPGTYRSLDWILFQNFFIVLFYANLKEKKSHLIFAFWLVGSKFEMYDIQGSIIFYKSIFSYFFTLFHIISHSSFFDFSWKKLS